MKTIGITGGTGFIGRHLAGLLVNRGHKVVIYTTHVAKEPQRREITYANWNPDRGSFDINGLKEIDAMVHLGGAGIADKRWTKKRKQEIVDSRVKSTTFLVQQLKAYASNCRTFIAASAIGYYGPDQKGASPFTETAPACNDFLGTTCKEWERCSMEAADTFRTIILRFGIALGKDGGAFERLAQPLSFGVMPILGGGRQVMSWISIDDLTHLINYALETEAVRGIYNAVAPGPTTHAQLMQTIAREKHGIKIPIPVPAAALKLLLGEMSEEILKSCTVSGQKILDAGFRFQHPGIEDAVRSIVQAR